MSAVRLPLAFDLHVHQDTLARGVAKQAGKLAFVELEVLCRGLRAVDDRRDEARALEGLDRVPPGGGAGLGADLELVSHKKKGRGQKM